MAEDSTFVFEEGTPIEVGRHGQHSFVNHNGDPVVDEGKSPIVFENGVGLGASFPEWSWDTTDDGTSPGVELGGDANFSGEMIIEHGGGGSGLWPAAQRTKAVDMSGFYIEITDVTATQNSRENNFNFGITDRGIGGNPYATNETADHKMIVYQASEEISQSPSGKDFLHISNGDGTTDGVETSNFDALSLNGDTLRIEYDGSTATLYVNGSPVASVTKSFTGTLEPTITLEDDPDSSAGDRLEIGTYDES